MSHHLHIAWFTYCRRPCDLFRLSSSNFDDFFLNFDFMDLLLIPYFRSLYCRQQAWSYCVTNLTFVFSLAGNDGACIFHVGPVKKGGRELHGYCIYVLFSMYIFIFHILFLFLVFGFFYSEETKILRRNTSTVHVN